ncbi:hypothetical protein [uncultured Flavobacterium sp.]|mgnify:CR=1 FL=1|uniref:hypothetical protein n=1 Tax=uncultured Flavobacterium sp. TaxID=165435 RepID=UPI0030CA1D66|tara:strand:+ start:842 stop:1084 length:243 start_codon:yes stop_codon:yes gene_type:complete
MDTIKELESWMLNNNINNIYLPKNKSNKYVTDIGEGLEDIHGLYVWYSNDEKGNRTDIKYFKSEKDAVQFVFEYLNHNEK